MSLRRGTDTQIPDAEVRRIAKTWNFSNVYGESEKSSGKMHQIPAQAAAELYRYFRGLMPKAIAWKASQFEKMRKYGYVISRLGRKRRFPVINESNQAEARKSSFNAPIQGAASDITMLAMIRLLNEGYKVIMTVHDSILIEVAKEDAEAAKEHTKEVMREVASHYVPEVPWKADADYGPRWEKY
jgi:DNA polymerase-1